MVALETLEISRQTTNESADTTVKLRNAKTSFNDVAARVPTHNRLGNKCDVHY